MVVWFLMSIMTHALNALDEYKKAFTIYLKSLAEKKEDGTKEKLKKFEQCSGN